MVRVCSRCGESKHHSNFYTSRGRLHAECKECTKKRVRAWQKANPDRVQAAVQKFQEANPGTNRNQARAYAAAEAELREKHRDEFERLYRKHKRRQQVAS